MSQSHRKERAEEEVRISEIHKSHVDYKLMNSLGKMGKEVSESEKAGSPMRSPQIAEVVRPEVESPRDRDDKHGGAETEKEKLKRQLAELDDRAEKLREKRELEVLRKEVEERQKVVGDLEASARDIKRGSQTGARPKTSKQNESRRDKFVSRGMLTNIDSLINNEQLKDQVKKELKKLGLGEMITENSSDSESDSSDSDDSLSYSENKSESDESDYEYNLKASKERSSRIRQKNMEG